MAFTISAGSIRAAGIIGDFNFSRTGSGAYGITGDRERRIARFADR